MKIEHFVTSFCNLA